MEAKEFLRQNTVLVPCQELKDSKNNVLAKKEGGTIIRIVPVRKKEGVIAIIIAIVKTNNYKDYRAMIVFN